MPLFAHVRREEAEMDDQEPDTLSDTLSQIVVCRRAKYGCVWAWSYQMGGETTARRIRVDHEDNLCLFRHLPI